MNQQNLPNELSPTFLSVISDIKSKVLYDQDIEKYFLRSNNDNIPFDYVEEMLTERLAETELHYDEIGENEFKRIFEFGIKAINENEEDLEMQVSNKDVKFNEDEEEYEEEYEEEEVEEEEEEEGELSPADAHFEFISEIIQEVKAVPDMEDEYLEIRIQNGLKMRNISITSTLND